jgi:cyclopropane fatty-acyl-phospholipid synthase-like methyltransferase
LKYSCCLYPTAKETLEQAENEMLESYVVKAGLIDGMELLDLGCGWGSLSLFLAEVSHHFHPLFAYATADKGEISGIEGD